MSFTNDYKIKKWSLKLDHNLTSFMFSKVLTMYEFFSLSFCLDSPFFHISQLKVLSSKGYF